jgi:hypothetical protein
MIMMMMMMMWASTRVWKSIRENKKASATETLGYYEFKQHELWFDDKCSKLFDQRKQAKLHWLQNPTPTNGDYLNNARCETRKTFRKHS